MCKEDAFVAWLSLKTHNGSWETVHFRQESRALLITVYAHMRRSVISHYGREAGCSLELV